MRILIVDDEQRICKSWRNLLTRAGHDVGTCGTVKQAERMLRDQTPWDAVMIDMLLEDGDGRDLIQRVPADRRMGVALITGHLEAAHVLQMQALGVLACPKPTTAEEVLALCDMLNHRQNAKRGAPTRLMTWAAGFRLSPAETTVLELGAAGLTNGDIAQKIQRSKHTVDTHWQRIFDKCGLRGRASVIAAASGASNRA